ncbi:MAG: CAP domain-containing protein [Syntrophomonadaceae bacterium]
MKKLITAGLAVWLGLIWVHNLSVVAPAPVAVPVTVAIPETLPAPEPDPAVPAAPAPIQDNAAAPEPRKPSSDAASGRSGSMAAKTPAPDPSRGTAVKPSPGMAAEMLQLINAERAQHGLAPLALDSRLSNGAYLKSKDMGVNGYFSHTSPTYGDPFQMMKSLGITYRAAAENIARNRTVSAAHTAFMNSAGHRANILDPSYQKVGLGFYQRGRDLYVTQWFTN